MKETEQEVLNYIPDPHAKLVREKWTTEEKTRQILPNGEVQTCNSQCR